MLRPVLRRILIPTLVLIAAFATTPARSEFGLHVEDITGFVTTTGGEPIAGAEVVVLGTLRRAQTDDEGRFRLAQVPATEAQLVISAAGYSSSYPRLDLGRDLDAGGLQVVLEDLDRDSEKRWMQLLSAMNRPGLGDQLGVPGPIRAADVLSSTRLHTRFTAQSNGRTDPAIREESILRGGLQVGGLTGPLHLALTLEGLDAESTPSNPQLSRPGPFDLYPVSLRDLSHVRGEALARLDVGPTIDLLGGFNASFTEGDAYSLIWSRPGWVQTFLDTTQTGDVVRRRGHFSDEKLDESYEYFDPSGHLPNEERNRADAYLSFQHRVSATTRYTAGLEFQRQSLDSRVGNKTAWQYEGDRINDFWFNYVDREPYPFFAISGDFPRLAEAEADVYRAKMDLRTQVSAWTLSTGGQVGYRDSRYFEVLHPYSTNADGTIGAERVEHREHDPSASLFVGAKWVHDEVEIESGLTYDLFELTDLLPVSTFDDDLESEWNPHFRLAYDILPSTALSFQWDRSLRKPDAEDVLDLGGRTFVRFPVSGASDLETETITSLRTALAWDLGKQTRLQLAGFLEETDNHYIVQYRATLGQVGTVPTLANGLESTYRGVELEVSRQFDGLSSGALRYTLSEREGDATLPIDPQGGGYITIDNDVLHPDDARHRIEASVDFRLDDRFWLSTEFRFESGRPFTPIRTSQQGGLFYGDAYSERLPSLTSLDLRAEYPLPFLTHRISVHAAVHNALDTRNLVNLTPVNWPLPPEAAEIDYLHYYSETGKTGGAYRVFDREAEAYNWIRLNDPRMVGPARSVVLGLTARF